MERYRTACARPEGLIVILPVLGRQMVRAGLVHAFAHSRSGIKHKLQLFAMAPDASESLGEGQIIYDGCCDLPTLEGPKVYQRAGWYFTSLLLRAGLQNGWQTVLRAPDDGPWEAKTCFPVETPR